MSNFKNIILLSEDEIKRLIDLQLYGDSEVVRDRCLMGYYQMLTDHEFRIIDSRHRIDRDRLMIPPNESDTGGQIIQLHSFTRDLFKKWGKIPVLDTENFHKHFDDLMIMASIKGAPAISPAGEEAAADVSLIQPVSIFHTALFRKGLLHLFLTNKLPLKELRKKDTHS
jgi:hypothetical protein